MVKIRMKQQTFAGSEFEQYRKVTRKETFLKKMDEILPWTDLKELIEPFYPKAEGAGRKPIGIIRMLKIYFLQHWFQLSDPGAEEGLYDSRAFREFVGIDLGTEPVPDETTILKFRHLLEQHKLGEQIFETINKYLRNRGIKVNQGTIVDATIIEAPTSTKNREQARDPEMKQTKKGNQWHFGMKTHIGVDSKTKIIHSVVVTPANIHDSQVIGELLHGNETRVWGDAAYTGQKEEILGTSPGAKDFTHKKSFRNKPLSEREKQKNRWKSSIRVKVEHVFHILKCQFRFTKTRYRGIEKNRNHVFTYCALANMVLFARLAK
jgi:transposase, IS5 family